MIIRQITSQLLSPTEKMKVQLSVGLSDSRGEASYCSIYNSGGFAYLNVTPYIQLTIKYFDPTRQWNKLDNIFLTQKTIATFRSGLKEFYDTMIENEDDIFSYSESGYISSISNTNKYTRIVPGGKHQAIRLEPIELYSTENGRPIPGVSIEINCKENRVELSIDEFEMFNELIQTIQIHQEGMILLHMYMTICLKNGGLTIPVEEGSGAKQPSSNNVQVNIFEAAQKRKNDSKRNNETMSGPSIVKQPTTLEEM